MSENETWDIDPLPETATFASGRRPTTDPAALGEIGPYRLLERIGAGGMGEVWLAEQRAPVLRRVALKLIAAGSGSHNVLARFDSERQALAMMDHPSIAKIFDAGTATDGRPFFVMEYVAGASITEHCFRRRMKIPDRIALFAQVCDGVQHAHQKAVIHRDLKPSNVLVSMQDGNALPKIIDFGLAKALSGRLTDSALQTEYGAMVGTPEYMSPEQADGTKQDIDTRTDVYSLGVMLYELLAGGLPFDSRRLREAGPAGMQKILMDEEPPTPSQRLSLLSAEESAAVARRSDTELPALRRHLEGDLDLIAMKAMEKDRERRYASPADLAQDIRRHLADEPVLAVAPTLRYRATKFTRRHRIAVLAVGCVVTALILGIVGTTVGLFRARRAEARAVHEADTAERVAGFLSNLLEGVNPQRMGALLIEDLQARATTAGAPPQVAAALAALPGTDTARRLLDEEILARAAASIDTQVADDAAIRARLRHTLGRVYVSLGMPNEADRHALQALRARQQMLGDEHPDTLSTVALLGEIRYWQGRYAEAEEIHRRTFETGARVLGAENRDTLWSMTNLASDLRAQVKFDESEAIYRRALVIQRHALGPEDDQTLNTMNDLGFLLQSRGKYLEAGALHRETLAIRTRLLGPESRDTLWSLYNVAWAELSQNHLDEAGKLFQQCLDVRRRVIGADHPDTLWAMQMLAAVRFRQGLIAEAGVLQRESFESRLRVLGADHPDLISSLELGARMAFEGDRFEDARRIGEQELALRRKFSGDQDAETQWSLLRVRRTCLAGGWLEDIRQLDREMLSGLCEAARRPGAAFPALVGCAFALLDGGHASRSDAEEALLHADQSVRATGGKDTFPLAALALAQYTLGNRVEAVKTQKQAVDLTGAGRYPIRPYLESELARFREGR